MVYKAECVTCKLLPICKKTSADKVLSHFVCEHFEEVPNEMQVVKARCDIINSFGAAGIYSIAPSSRKPKHE